MKEVWKIESWKKFKGFFCKYNGMKVHKATECNVRNQRMNIPSRNEVKNQKNKCLLCGKQGH